MNIKNDRLFFMIQGILKYLPFQWAISLRRICYRPFFKMLGRGVQIKDGVTFKYPSEISIGDGAKIGEFSYFVGKGGLVIGNNFLAGAGSKVITSFHVFDDPTQPIAEQGLRFEPIHIGQDVWLGFDVKIFGGVEVGDGAILGANTLVLKGKIPALSIVAGSPARVIRQR